MTLAAAADLDRVPDPPIEWTVNPWRESPRRALAGATAVAAMGAVLIATGIEPRAALLLWLALAAMLAPAFWSVRCRVDEDGVARRLFMWERRPWAGIRRARVGPHGLFVTPNPRPGALDRFRGLWLPAPGVATDLVPRLRRRLDAHGL